MSKPQLSRRSFCILTTALFILLAQAATADNMGSGVLVYETGGNIYTCNIDGTGQKALTDSGDTHHPKWSPDGSKILYIRNTSLQTVLDADGKPSEIGQPTDFYIMNRDGTDQHLVKHLSGVVNQPSWSPDSKLIGFYYQSKEEWLHQGVPSFVGGFYTMPILGDERPRLISTDARFVDWAPDGNKIVFLVDRPKNHTALHTANIDGSGEAQLLDEDIYIDADSPKWSPDGSLIAFRGTVPRRTADDKVALQGIIGVVEPDGKNALPLTYDLGWDCWHPWWDRANKNKLIYSCYTMPQCTPEAIKKRPDDCVARTYSLSVKDPYAKPLQIAEQKGTAASNLHEIAP